MDAVIVDVLLFVVVSLRAIIELVVWLMIGRAFLRLLAGRGEADNAVLRLFDLILKPPRALMRRVWPTGGFVARELLLAGLLVSLWLSLAVAKWWLAHRAGL